MSNRVNLIEHRGTKIRYADYSGTSEEEFMKTIAEFEGELRKQTPGSVTTLTNVTDTVVTGNVAKALKEMSKQTQGISIAAAGVGITGFKKVIAAMVRRDLYYANSLEEAKDWLAKQAKK